MDTDGNVKKLMSVKSKYNRIDYKYKMKERMVSRKEAIDACLKVLDGKELTRQEISERTGIDISHLHNLIAKMKDFDLIRMLDYRRDGHVVYTKHYECLLATMLLPSPEQIAKQFKVKSIIKRTVDDGTSKSLGYKGSNIIYNKSVFNNFDME